MPLKTLGLAALALALSWASPPAAAQTMLTNGSQIFVSNPPLPNRTVINGADGFTIFVPPGATELRVEFHTQPNLRAELLTTFGRDVGTDGMGGRVVGARIADYRALPNNNGDAVNVISPITHPPLEPGIYFIGFFTRADDVEVVGFLKATVSGGPVDQLFSVVESDFDNDADGWMLNDAPSPIPGTTVAHRDTLFEHFPAGGNPGGFIRVRSIVGPPTAVFVAPEKFHVNFLGLNDPRIEFDIARLTGIREPDQPIEIRVYGERGGYTWKGHFPLPPNGGWTSASVPIRFDFWRIFSGPQPFVEVFSNPKRIEVRAAFSLLGGASGLDNFRILDRGIAPPRPVLSTVTSFSAGIDDWDRNFRPGSTPQPSEAIGDEDSRLVWVDGEGNPGPFIRLAESGGPGRDAFVAPLSFRGIYTGLSNPRFEFDYYHTSFTGASRPVTIRIFGAGAIYEWTGKPPSDIWAHQIAPLTPGVWTLVSGAAAFEQVLENITRIEIAADLAVGAEWNQLDNFAVLSDGSPPLPQFLTSNPRSLAFQGAATQPSPEGQRVQITSASGVLRWSAAVTGDLADRVTLSEQGGDTPSRITVSVDTGGLAAGAHTATLVISAVGATVPDHSIPITLELDDQPRPTPVISQNGVVHAANYRDQLAAGVLAVIFGTDLGGPPEGVSASFVGPFQDRLPKKIDAVRVLVYETYDALIAEAPILYLSDRQINFQMPFEVAGRAFVRIVIDVGGVRSEPHTVQIINNAPGIFVFGGERAVATNSDGSLNTASNPASRLKPLTLFLTGQGVVAPLLETGRAATGAPLIRTPDSVQVWIGGVEAKVEFAGLTPGLVGVLQLNVIPRSQTPVGDQPIWCAIGGFGSNIARVTMK